MVEIKKIMAAVDGSEGSMLALETAETVARNNKASLIVVYVDHRPGASSGSDASIFAGDPNMQHVNVPYNPEVGEDDGKFRTAKRVLNEVKDTLQTNLDVEYHILFGNPSAEIVYFAEKIETDMIIIGKHGYSGFKKFMMGSVSAKVVNNAECTVVVVR